MPKSVGGSKCSATAHTAHATPPERLFKALRDKKNAGEKENLKGKIKAGE